MLCLFKECFSKEDDNYDCKWMELIVCFYICRTVEYWSAKHWLVKRPTELIQQTQTSFFFLGNDGTDLLIGVLRVWGKTVEVHLMIATTWNSLGNFGVQPQEGFFHQSTKFLLITLRNPKMYAHSSKKETFAACWCMSVVKNQPLWMRKMFRGLNQHLYPLHDEWDGGMIQALRLSEGCKVP